MNSTEFLKRAAAETPEVYKEKMMSLYGGDQGFGIAPGMGGMAADALNARLNKLYQDEMGLKRESFKRGLSSGYFDYTAPAMDVANIEEQKRQTEELIRAQASAAAKARRRGMAGAILGTAGAAAGGAFGGPAGAAIGGGIGTTIGGSVG